MRAILFLLLLAPFAAAAQPTDPYVWSAAISGEPAVGETVTLNVTLVARSAIDAELRLDVPPWVKVEEPIEWHAKAAAGERITHAWRLTATRDGFWRVPLVLDASEIVTYAVPVEQGREWHTVATCCGYAWSTQGRGQYAETPEGAIPGESTVGFHPSFRALDTMRAELTVRVSPQDKRYAGQELLFYAPHDAKTPQRAPAEAAKNFTHAFPLAPGASGNLSASAAVEIVFRGGDLAREDVAWQRPVACAKFQVARTGDAVNETGRSGCSGEPPPTADAQPPRRSPVPATPWIAVALVALALTRRRA